MKKIIVAILIGSSISTVYAQKIKAEDVPLVVKNEFKKHFPNAKVEVWEKEGVNFEAEFDVNKIETSALINANGNLLETESAISVSALPKMAKEYLSKTYKSEKIKEVA
ncbi:MAG TPA: PepSY-like domain-containing protein, partial [Hanamia sp.]